jgi:UPF0716 protein FxsA
MIFPYLLLLFVVLPITELALLLKVHEFLSLGGTLVLVIGTGVLGASLARWQGVRQLGLIQQAMAAGTMPAPHLVDGVLILIAGAVLVTPGLLTDCAGFFLLFPPGRKWVKTWVGKWLQRRLQHGVIDVTHVEW